MKDLEAENARLKKVVANLTLDIDILKDVNSRKWLRPTAKRWAACAIALERKISKARACRVLGLNRSTLNYKNRPKDDEKLSSRMQQLASQHRRWGVVTIHDVCKREGLVVNPKRSLRLYRKLKLQIKLRPKKKGNVIRMPIAKPKAPNEVWSMDFIFDRLANGRALKILNVVDDFSRRCVGQIVASSITRKSLADFFSRMDIIPRVLRCDNGPEFWSSAFQSWAQNKVMIDLSSQENHNKMPSLNPLTESSVSSF